MVSSGYPAHTWFNCIDAFREPERYDGDWLPCPSCGAKPRVWVFDNGEHTACMCWDTMYSHHDIQAEPILDVYRRAGDCSQYSRDGLRRNWNHWVETGERLFVPGKAGK